MGCFGTDFGMRWPPSKEKSTPIGSVVRGQTARLYKPSKQDLINLTAEPDLSVDFDDGDAGVESLAEYGIGVDIDF
jgi:hypothetical protein